MRYRVPNWRQDFSQPLPYFIRSSRGIFYLGVVNLKPFFELYSDMFTWIQTGWIRWCTSTSILFSSNHSVTIFALWIGALSCINLASPMVLLTQIRTGSRRCCSICRLTSLLIDLTIKGVNVPLFRPQKQPQAIKDTSLSGLLGATHSFNCLSGRILKARIDGGL